MHSCIQKGLTPNFQPTSQAFTNKENCRSHQPSAINSARKVQLFVRFCYSLLSLLFSHFVHLNCQTFKLGACRLVLFSLHYRKLNNQLHFGQLAIVSLKQLNTACTLENTTNTFLRNSSTMLAQAQLFIFPSRQTMHSQETMTQGLTCRTLENNLKCQSQNWLHQ